MSKKKLKKTIKFSSIFFVLIILIVSRYLHVKKINNKEFKGTIYTKEINIFSTEPEKIKKILVQENDFVKKNDLIIEFDLVQIDKKISNIKAIIEYEKSKDKFLKFKEEKILEEYLNLKKHDYKDLKIINNKLKELESTQLIRNIQNKKIPKIEAELQFYEAKRENKFIYSPCNGTIQNINANVDQNIRSNELLLTISDSDHIWLCAKIRKNLISKYKIGDNFNIFIEDIPYSKFKGKLFSISQIQKDKSYIELKFSVNQLKMNPSEKTYTLTNGMIATLKHE